MHGKPLRTIPVEQINENMPCLDPMGYIVTSILYYQLDQFCLTHFINL